MVFVVRQLIRSQGRTLLTLLGVAMGIALLVSITTYSASLKDQIQQTVTKHFDIVIQSKGATSPLASRLTKTEYDQLKPIQGISGSTAIVIGGLKTREVPYFLLAGASSLEPLIGTLHLGSGRMLQFGNREILLGQQALKRFHLNVGDTIELNREERFHVVGTYITGSRFMDQGALLDLKDAQRLLNRGDSMNLALIRLQPGQKITTIMKRIETHMPQLNILKSRDLLGEIRMFIVVDKIAWGMSIIALIISGVFVINTLIMSISERTKEIGILMAVGWTRAMIVKTILWESIIICGIGCLIGIPGGWLLVWLASRSNITGLDWTATTPSVGTILWAIAMALCLGMISAVYPAVVASRLTPAQALRYE
ncbi:MAG: ABC transporter permease [Deltaproteobacteria bacterium]|nr:ABC transporter permease [Deltaproteobacteria bacterium]